MDKVVHFEVPFEDKGRVEGFYSKVFGWKLNPVPDMNYTVVHTVDVDENMMPKESGAINGGLFKRTEDLKNLTIVIEVSSIDEKLGEVKENGGEIIKEKTAVGNMGYVAYIKDTEGNIVGLWEIMKKK